MAERGIGEGDGESEGQELIERRSEEVLALTERGRINTVIFKLDVLSPRNFENVVIFRLHCNSCTCNATTMTII